MDILIYTVLIFFEYAKGIGRDPFEIRKEQDTARNNFLCRCDSYFDWHIDRAKITVLSQILGGLIETTGVIETVFDDGLRTVNLR